MSKKESKRKLYVGVLIIGVIALVGDRLLLAGGLSGGPQSADASEFAVEPPGSPRVAPVAQTPTTRIAELLDDRRAYAGEATDLFDARRVFGEDMPIPSVDIPGAPAGPDPAAFAGKHTLKSVLLAGEGGGAVRVGDRTLRLGDTLDGFTLVEIGARSAIFTAGDVRAELRLRDDAPPTDSGG